MPIRAKVYVAAVAVAALFCATLVVLVAPPMPGALLRDTLLLCGLAVGGEMLAFMLPHRTLGSIAFIPYLAAAVLVPSWQSILSVTLVRAVLEIAARRPTVKLLFNIASQALTESLTILCFLGLGGTSLLAFGGRANLTIVTTRLGAPAIISFAAVLFFNNFVVCVAVALASKASFRTVLIDATRSTWILDLLTSPVVFVFAWVYAAFGPIAASASWVPILGLVHVHRINLELERTNEELLELMVKSLEARDPYTSGHSRRVHQYATIIARAIGLSESAVANVGHAALLHDVGKIYEKYAPVLAKQDHLTPEEWAIIRDHPVDGANLVATMSRLREIVPSIRHHHENWDGTGYPDGIAGELIPLAARIIRFADTIDAMTTERPYRKPLTEQQVRAEIIRCRGTQFDPEIADQLLSSALWVTLFTPPDRHSQLALVPATPVRVQTSSRSASA